MKIEINDDATHIILENEIINDIHREFLNED